MLCATARGGTAVSGRRTTLVGFVVKDGKIVAAEKRKRQSVSDRIKARKSKRVRIAKPGPRIDS